jgi:NifU-like protein
MWDYTDKVKEHFRNPKNVGYIKEPDGIGEVGSLACGDALRLMFKLDAEGRIEDCKFQTFGCGSAIASSSALTEMILGMTIEEAEKVTNQQIAEHLGGLPDQKMHCSVMGREALEAAIENYRTGQTGGQKKLEGKVTCICFGVTEKDIERAITENHLATMEEVTNYTKAGGGCGGCQEEIQEIIARVTGAAQAAVAPPEPPKKKRLTNIQKIAMITETIEREVRPALRKDGGDIELIDVDGDTVIVSMRGNCAQCRVASFTLRDVVQAKLREFVSDEIVVVEE